MRSRSFRISLTISDIVGHLFGRVRQHRLPRACRAAPQLMISGNSRCMRYSELTERWKERERAAAEAELLSEQFEK